MKFRMLIALLLLSITSCVFSREESIEDSQIVGSWSVNDIDEEQSLTRVFTFNSDGTLLVENFDFDKMPKSISYGYGTYTLDREFIEFNFTQEFKFLDGQWHEKFIPKNPDTDQTVSASDFAPESIITYYISDNRLTLNFNGSTTSICSKIQSHPIRSN
jgi:hypothetical protein